MKKEPHEHTGNIDDAKQLEKLKNQKKKPDENKTQENVSETKTEKESRKSISRWDTDGGTDLCP